MEQDLIKFTQLGVSGIAVVVLFLVVKYFLKAQKETTQEFTTFLKIQQQDSKEIITNHLSHDQQLHEATIKQMAQLEKSNDAMNRTIAELLDFIKRK